MATRGKTAIILLALMCTLVPQLIPFSPQFAYFENSVPSRGSVDYTYLRASGSTHIYEFYKYTTFAPWWRGRLSDNAALRFTSIGLNFSGSWGFIYLAETVGNRSAVLEVVSDRAAFGVGFVTVDGSSWKVQWHDDRLWFYYASDVYGTGKSEYQILDARTPPTRLGIEYVNSSTIEYYADFHNSSVLRSRFVASSSMLEPKYVQLFFGEYSGSFSRLWVGQSLDHIIHDRKPMTIGTNLPYGHLNLTSPRNSLSFGVIAQSPGSNGKVGFSDASVREHLDFLKQYNFGTIKLLLHWQVLMPSVGTFNETALQWMMNFTRWMNNEGFHVLLSMQSCRLDYLRTCNKTYEHNDEWLNYVLDNNTIRNSLLETWTKIAQKVRNLDVTYELLNEPDPAESSGIDGFDKLTKFVEDAGNAIRGHDSNNTIYFNVYQWQDKHHLWATRDVSFNFTNYGFSLHVYPTDYTWQLGNFGYDDRFISWLKDKRFPIMISEIPMTALDPWIREEALSNLNTWVEAWEKTFSFVLEFEELRRVIFLRYMVTARDAYSSLALSRYLFDALNAEISSG